MRTSQQDERLRTLRLEKEFQRRAEEALTNEDEDEDDDEDDDDEDERHSSVDPDILNRNSDMVASSELDSSHDSVEHEMSASEEDEEPLEAHYQVLKRRWLVFCNIFASFIKIDDYIHVKHIYYARIIVNISL